MAFFVRLCWRLYLVWFGFGKGKLTSTISISGHTGREIGICIMHSLHNRYICIFSLRGGFRGRTAKGYSSSLGCFGLEVIVGVVVWFLESGFWSAS